MQWAFILILLLGGFFIVRYGITRPVDGQHVVTMRVESSGGYSTITMEAGDEKIGGGKTVSTPWEKTVTVPSGKPVYLTASNPSHTGTLTCWIKLDYGSWKTDKTNAPKDGVACAGIVP